MQHKKFLQLALILLAGTLCQAQNALPTDPAVRIGQLPNGLTYYIRHNNLPENRVDFHIAQRVGSILEEENQRGLAHFLEHMAFNGSAHFPGNSMQNYLETVGVKFGENLNAYTGIDETVYLIKNVPATRPEIIDSCLLILHDWSNALLLNDNEIDKERGVIHEEWRTRQSAAMRMYEKVLPEIYGTDRYASRLPIGLMSVVDNFRYQELKDYYRKWYRPDLQALVIVGDVDVDDIERRVKEIFADIPAPENPAVREYFPVSDNREPIVATATDPEATTSYMCLFFKHAAVPVALKRSPDYLVISYIRALAAQMMTMRFGEMAQKKDAPFVLAEADDCEFFLSKTKDAWEVQAVCKENRILPTLAAVTQETERVRRFGFTETEFARAKADFLKAVEVEYNEREKQKNSHYTELYIDHFLDAEPVPGIDFEYLFYNQIAEKLTVDDINKYMNDIIADENVVILLMANDKTDVPDKNALLETYKNARAAQLEPYTDNVKSGSLLKKEPKKQSAKAESAWNFGATQFTLKNGIRVIVKPTEFKKDQILMSAYSLGGTSLLDERQMPTVALINDLIDLGGVGRFSNIDLLKQLAGKNITLAPQISLNSESLNGSCTPSDLETFLQLVYLYFTQPRADDEAFESYISSQEAVLSKVEQNPDVAFRDSIYRTIYGNHPRAKSVKSADLQNVDYALAQKMYAERFQNADKFTFVFVGNIRPDSAQTLIAKYIGALPKVKRAETFRDTKFEPGKGERQNIFSRELETRKSSVFTYYSGTCDYTLENAIRMSFLSQIMRIVYTRTIREAEGGSYGVSVRGSLEKFPAETFSLQISFDTDPEKCTRMKEIMYAELKKFRQNGPSDDDFGKVKEFMAKRIKELKAENSFWLSAIRDFDLTGTDKASAYESTLNAVTKDDLRTFADQILSQKNRVEVTMNPKEK